MKIFDLHCDTIEALKNNNEIFDNSITQFTMKGQELTAKFRQEDKIGNDVKKEDEMYEESN